MNRIYSLVFNRTTGLWQVANEHAKGRSKRKSRAAALITLAVTCASPLSVVHAVVTVIGDVTPIVNWSDADDLVVGDTAAGSLQIELTGTTVRSASGWLGLTTGGVGTAKVTGLGASWVMNGSLVVGASGSGTLTLANDGKVSVGMNGSGKIELGRNPGATGVINIGSKPGSVATDSAGIVDASEISFGAGAGTINFNSLGYVTFRSTLNSRSTGQHQLNHYAGVTQLLGDNSKFNGNTRASGGNLHIRNILGTAEGRIDAGTLPGATALVSVFTPGSSWALSQNLFIGGDGPGELNLFDSGMVSNHFATVDAKQNGTASVAISDAGSRWVNRAALLVGSEGGRGAVSILAGGYVSSVDGVIGRLQNGNGTVLVTGRDSTWDNARELRVGDAEGQGTLTVEGAGSVSNVDSFVGSKSGSGNVVVRGAGSTWNNSGAMTLGFDPGTGAGAGAGAGSLTIAQGGVVNVGASNMGTVSLAKDSLLFYRTSGTINIGAPVGQSAVGAGTLNAGAIQFGNGNATVNFNHSSTAYTFSAQLSSTGNGSHRVNQIAGTTRLTGDNGAFLGKTTVSGGRLVVLNQLGGAAEVTGGTLQYGDATTGAANRLAGDLQVSGTGSTLAVQGTASLGVAGNVGMADHTILDLTAGTLGAALRADTVTLGANVTFRLGGVYSNNTSDVVLIDTTNGILGDFARLNTSGSASAVDYLSVSTRKSANNLQYLASYGLTWAAHNNQAHGTFTLANTADTFTVGAVLADQTANPVTGWNGKTLTKAGNGTLMLSGANTYSGGTSITGGTVAIERDANLGAATGGLLLNGGTLATTASFDSARTITVANAGGIDVAANTALHLTGAFTGNGDFTKSGNGLLTLQGDSSGFTGQTLVNAGQLIINGLFGGSLTLGNGALLGGNATIGSAHSTLTVASGGTLSPGNSIGLVTVKGDLVMQPGSHFVVETDPDGTAADRVHVTGNALLNGGSVMHIGAAGNYGLQSNYTIMQVDGTLSGRFDTVASDFAFLTPSLAYDYGQGRVSLNLDRNDVSMSLTGSTPNQRATAAAIDSIGVNSGHALYNAVVSLPNDAKLLHASFDQLSGEVHASAKTALLQDSLYLRDAMGDRLQGSFTEPTSWLQALGNWNHVNSNSNTGSLNSSSGGFLMGIDAPIANNWQLGLLAGYSRTSFDVNSRSSSGHSNNYHVGAYTGGQWGAVRLQGGVAYSWNNLATRRSVNMPGFTDQLNASYDGHTAQAFVDVGYGIDASVVTLEPFANLAYVNLRTNRYSESGGAAALQAAGQTTDTTLTTLGLRATTDFDVGSTQVVARGSLGWRHAMGDITPYSTHAFSAGRAFDVAGAALARDSAVVELGLAMQLKAHTSLGLSYQGQISDSTQNHGVKANLLVRF